MPRLLIVPRALALTPELDHHFLMSKGPIFLFPLAPLWNQAWS